MSYLYTVPCLPSASGDVLRAAPTTPPSASSPAPPRRPSTWPSPIARLQEGVELVLVVLRPAAAGLDEHVEGVGRGERVAAARDVLDDQLQAGPVQELDSAHYVAQLCARCHHHVQHGLEGLQGEEGHVDGGGLAGREEVWRGVMMPRVPSLPTNSCLRS